MKKYYLFCLILVLAFACTTPAEKTVDKDLAGKIKNNEYFPLVKAKALEVMKAGFNAGDGYREVWIRDYNTFIELAAQVNSKDVLKENLLVFFRMQGEDGNIIDGFTPADPRIDLDSLEHGFPLLHP